MENHIIGNSEKDLNPREIRGLRSFLYVVIQLEVDWFTYILNAQDGTQIPFKDLKKSDAITAYYGPSAGTIVLNGKELALSVDDRIERNGNTLMLPLRVIAESRGYNVVWDDEAKTVELQNGARTMATMTIGSKTYGKFKMAVQLDYAPKIVNGKTLVPVEFFTDLLQLKVKVNNSHI